LSLDAEFHALPPLSGPGDAVPPLPGAGRRGHWFALAMAFTLVRALPNISYPIGRDQAVYCVIGRGLLEGKQLYLDYWDNRSPVYAYLYAGIVNAFGPVMWCVGAVDILWLLVIAYCIFRFTERCLGPAAGAMAVAVYVSWHAFAGYWHAAQAETFQITFIFAAFFLVARQGGWVKLRHFTAGLVFGAAFWTKYNGGVLMPVVILLPYLALGGLDERPPRLCLTIPWRQWFLRAGIFAVGFLATIALILTYFWHVGSLEEFRLQQMVVLPRYVAMAAERTPHLWLWSLVRIETVMGLLTEVAAATALYLAWRQREMVRMAPIYCAAAASFISVAVQVRFHSYGFETCLPFFAMIWAYLAVKAHFWFRGMARACAARRWRVAQALVWVVLVDVVAWVVPGQALEIVGHYQVLATWWRSPDVSYASYPWSNPISHFPDQMRVIGFLRQNSRPGGSVFVWGSEPLINFMTETCQPTRFVLNLPLISPWSPPEWRDEVVRDLRKAPPQFVVVARDDALLYIAWHDMDSEEFLQVYPEFSTFLADDYELDQKLQFFKIYRRRGLPPGTAPAESFAPCR